MKIVVLDGYTENPGDLSWSALEQLGELVVYDRTSYEESDLVAERIGDANVAILNKTPISKATMDQCPNLKLIAVLATGYNVVDMAYAKEKGHPRLQRAQLRRLLRQPVCHRPDAGGLPPHRPPRPYRPRGQVAEQRGLVLLGLSPHRAGGQDLSACWAAAASASTPPRPPRRLGMHVIAYDRYPVPGREGPGRGVRGSGRPVCPLRCAGPPDASYRTSTPASSTRRTSPR